MTGSTGLKQGLRGKRWAELDFTHAKFTKQNGGWKSVVDWDVSIIRSSGRCRVRGGFEVLGGFGLKLGGGFRVNFVKGAENRPAIELIWVAPEIFVFE